MNKQVWRKLVPKGKREQPKISNQVIDKRSVNFNQI